MKMELDGNINKVMNNVHKALLERAEIMKTNRLSDEYLKKMDVMVEDYIESLIFRSYANAKVGYKDFDKAMESEGKSVNVLPLLKSLNEETQKLEKFKTPLSKLFSAKGKFLQGPLATQLRTSIKGS